MARRVSKLERKESTFPRVHRWRENARTECISLAQSSVRLFDYLAFPRVSAGSRDDRDDRRGNRIPRENAARTRIKGAGTIIIAKRV